MALTNNIKRSIRYYGKKHYLHINNNDRILEYLYRQKNLNKFLKKDDGTLWYHMCFANDVRDNINLDIKLMLLPNILVTLSLTIDINFWNCMNEQLLIFLNIHDGWNQFIKDSTYTLKYTHSVSFHSTYDQYLSCWFCCLNQYGYNHSDKDTYKRSYPKDFPHGYKYSDHSIMN